MPATFTIPDHIREILRSSTIYIPDKPSPANLHTLKLPAQLDRKDYAAVMKVIDGAGGVWDKKKGLHTFRRDPMTELGLAIDEGKGANLQQKFQAFYTPKALADRMAALLVVPDSYPVNSPLPPILKVLEPSCGEGALVRAVHRHNPEMHITGYDINPEALNRCGLGAKGSGIGGIGKTPEILNGSCTLLDFMSVRVPPKDADKYDFVISNPPFTAGQDAEHVCHALLFLKPGGRLVALMTPNVLHKETGHYKRLREMLVKESYHLTESTPIPAKTFADTDIETLMLVVDRSL